MTSVDFIDASNTQRLGESTKLSGDAIEPTDIHVRFASSDLLLSQIQVWGETLDDLEKVRIALGNRIAAVERDFGQTPTDLVEMLRAVKDQEHKIELRLCRIWRKHPLAKWAKEYHGLGEKSIARLIAAINDPGVRPTVSHLWSYCGHGDPNRKKRKGMSQEEALALGNPRAKKQVWLISSSMLKAGNRSYYDARRAKTEDREWTNGHKHADALRYQGKMFLRDLWVESRHLRDGGRIVEPKR